MSNVAIIPARGGSKRIPRKNIRDFLGKPIIAYSVEVALESGLFEEVMVSTEDEEIAEVAKKYGATVPFMRSEENADDHATIAEVVMEVLGEYKKQGKDFNLVCCLFATSPLTNQDILKESLNKLYNENFDAVFPIVEFSYPIFRALKLEENIVKMVWPEYLNTRSQDLMSAYHDSGSFYWVKPEALLEEKTLFCENSGALILNSTQVQDIDDLNDWAIAELKYKLLNNA